MELDSTYEHPQAQLFNRIRELKQGKMVPTVMKLLNLKKSAVYGKIKGEVSLTYLELIDICRHYDLSIDTVIYSLPENIAPYSFYSNNVKLAYSSYEDYVQNTLNHLLRIKDIPDLHITYICNEIPVVDLLQFPYVFALKMAMWDLMNWGIHPEFDEKRVKHYAEHKKIRKLSEEFYKTYVGVNSAEVWNTSMLTSTYKQILNLVRQKKLTDMELIERLLFEMKGLIHWLSNMVGLNEKYLLSDPKQKNSNFEIYLSELMSQNEMVAAKGKDFAITYLAYDSPNYIRSQDPRIIKNVEHMLERIKGHAINLSRAENKEDRDLFLKEMMVQYEYFRSQILKKFD